MDSCSIPSAILFAAIMVSIVFSAGFILSAYAQLQLFKMTRDI